MANNASYDAKFDFVAGDVTKAALFCARKEIEARGSTDVTTYSEITKIIRSGKLCPIKIQDHLRYPDNYLPSFDTRSAQLMKDSLNNLTVASALYRRLPGATVSISVVQIPMYTVKWAVYGPINFDISDFRLFGFREHVSQWQGDPNKAMLYFPKTAQFACIAMFESGTLNIDPAGLSTVMALSSGNSIFVVDSLLQDPSEQGLSITRLLGNLGRPSVVMLVPPQAPLIREADRGTWRLVNHYAFDGKWKTPSKTTSLHLSFTEYEIPLSVSVGAVDAEATMLETLISVYDRERWVADIDVLYCLSRSHFFVCLSAQDSEGSLASSTSKMEAVLRMKEAASKRKQLISTDCWEELLDFPDTLGGTSIAMVRAAKNWNARLATMCVCVQRGYLTQVLPTMKPLCIDCDQGLEDMLENTQVFIV
ncbi:hypothetical protein OEA41_001444 [Lepraria neglecta]|uniref:Uncharacterized protein n=1 Tax=Lepraria neglecta TaxID=209136 RepID=A0AAD9ZA40_9LECA|nr:hypothetical protein OEA41_001444 [Lepraria neglecta]